MMPLAIDLFCGLGGWTDGLLAAGWRVVGFDIERHRYPRSSIQSEARKVTEEGVNFNNAKGVPSTKRSFNYSNQVAYRNSIVPGEWDEYPAQLVLQDVLAIHGSQFRSVDLIVASPPCTEYSYMAMPWTRAKQIARALRGQDEFPDGYKGSRTIAELNALFDACFRIQREACEAAGRHIPLIVENVRGAQPWVGRATWNYGSYFLWGDLPALMPIPKLTLKGFGGTWFHNAELGTINPNRNRIAPDHQKVPGFNFHQHERSGKGGSFQSAAVKVSGDWFGRGENCSPMRMREEDYQRWLGNDGVKQPGINAPRRNGKGAGWFQNGAASVGSQSPARKAASAQIAKIPFALARWIGEAYLPRMEAATPTRVRQRAPAVEQGREVSNGAHAEH